jgi:hypothetical protein
MIGLDVLMVVYSLWVISTERRLGKAGAAIAGFLALWLAGLHLGLSSHALFPEDISGFAFLLVIFAAVGVVGALLLLVTPMRRLLLELDQSRLLLLQGIRVFFGGNFLMMAATGALPMGFGILDGFTHIGAGFFGLVAAFSLAAGVEGERRAWFANLFGLADILVVASSLALILLPELGPHHNMMYAVFLPAPLWLWFHLFSIWKLLRRRPAPSPVS